MTPPTALARSASAITSMSGSSARSTPSSVRMRSPGRARRTTIASARQALEIERVHRLAELEQHVVGDVDDVADRADAGGGQAVGQPLRRRADLHLEHLRAVARAEIGRLDRHVEPFDCAQGGPFAASRQAVMSGICRGRPQIADASRAMPTWLMQSGRLAVISKSITGVACPARPRRPRTRAG